MTHRITHGLILVLAFIAMTTGAAAQQYAAVVMDARTGQVLHARNADTRLHPASLTKMMTLYIVFDEIRHGRLGLDQKVTISRTAAAEPPSKLGLRPGQQIEVRYLIRAAAIRSANDASTALAEAVAGSAAAFAERMNLYARAMGMNNTTFKNAHGLTQAGHLSTARDMAVLGRRLMYDFPEYYNLFSRRSTSAGIATVQNTNRRLLDAYQGADGIKTGYTRAAGFNLVSSAQRGERRVIVSLFGGRTAATRNAEVARLMDLGFAQMPARARFAALPPLRLAGAPGPASVAGASGSAGSTAGLAGSPARVAAARPMPRGGARPMVSRNEDSIAQAIAEVNAALEQGSDRGAAPPASGRPLARPSVREAIRVASASAASTFAVAAPGAAQAAPAPATAPVAAEAAAVADPGRATTGGNAWGVQLGAFRTKGDAERHLLVTALQDVPELAGGLRRIEPARIDGVTLYRAQFVGMSEAAAVSACARLNRQQAECQPIAPGS